MGVKVERTHNIDNLSEAIKKAVQQGIKKGALLVERDAKIACPVDTGNLRASITTTQGDMEAEVGTNVEYAEYVEMGTSKKAARPYLYPALVNNRANIEKLIQNEIKNAAGGK